MKILGGLKGLKLLALDKTQVTDAGLKNLTGLKALEELDLLGTSVTDDGIAALEKALPGCGINH